MIEEGEAMARVVSAAKCIRHWHDTANGGMVVSGEHVRHLWSAIDEMNTIAGPNDEPPIAEDRSIGSLRYIRDKLKSGETLTAYGVAGNETQIKAGGLSLSESTGISEPDYEPDDVAFKSLPILRVRPYEPPRPTLDQMPEGDVHDCMWKRTGTRYILAHRDGAAWMVNDAGDLVAKHSEPNLRSFIVLDATPIPPETLADVPSGCWAVDENGQMVVWHRNNPEKVIGILGDIAKEETQADVKITRVIGYIEPVR